jgi:uncharacterized circularly permuted ATP-grasp superfamily protein
MYMPNVDAKLTPSLFYDEMFHKNGEVRSHYRQISEKLERMSEATLSKRQIAMNQRMMEEGITYTLYHENQHNPLERTIPFDLVPRIITQEEWTELERGLIQRTKALNMFLKDIYHNQEIIRDQLVPRKDIVTNRYFRPEMMRLKIPNDTYITCAGIDLIRDELGKYYVLEDNLRSPSGYSYVYKSRSIMRRLFHDLFTSFSVADVEQSLDPFLATLQSIAPTSQSHPTVGLLTPGSYNSAYFEHTYLAQQMGIELVEGRDLICMDHKIFMRTRSGLRKVDVLYRRIDDDFLDPLAFRADTMLGVAGLMNAYRAGHISIANAPGTGVADDKAIYTYVPTMIKYYLNEDPILPNVPTYVLNNPDELEFVLKRLDTMVVKETSLSGGYGMLIGPSATEEELSIFAGKIKSNPGNYIAQPTIKLSTAPIYHEGRYVPRHIDLRAFIFSGSTTSVLPGGLTRVAMKEGSLVVNSSQGGGCKDTWVLTK